MRGVMKSKWLVRAYRVVRKNLDVPLGVAAAGCFAVAFAGDVSKLATAVLALAFAVLYVSGWCVAMGQEGR